MITISYERYRNDHDRVRRLTERFTTLEKLADWIFNWMTFDYSDPKNRYCLGFWMAATQTPLKEPCTFEIRPDYPSDFEIWIHQIEDGDKIVFSDGTMTAGQKFWTDRIKAWMKKNYDRQMHPTFKFASREDEAPSPQKNAKAMLISVDNREILTERFDSVDSAAEAMRQEMILWADIERSALYEPDGLPKKEAETEQYGFDEDGGYANAKSGEFDWRIVLL